MPRDRRQFAATCGNVSVRAFERHLSVEVAFVERAANGAARGILAPMAIRAVIRRATRADAEAIAAVHIRAFGPDSSRPQAPAAAPVAEAELVEKLCASGDLIAALSLVAEMHAAPVGSGTAGSVIVGHVACSRGSMTGGVGHAGSDPDGLGSSDGLGSGMDGLDGIVGLAPLGVLPEFQGAGVGGALMHAVLGAADALGAPAVVLLGDPGYYGRFGFEPAARYGVLPPVAEWAPHFQLRRLTAWPATGAPSGTFHYAPAFDEL